ncbi:MAG: hypothetical protein MUF78_00465 [Candidatus Edwardsbacteria bacterium]|nr:hypothetical protein [Candidatus Edwardsbacteria bacterium]
MDLDHRPADGDPTDDRTPTPPPADAHHSLFNAMLGKFTVQREPGSAERGGDRPVDRPVADDERPAEPEAAQPDPAPDDRPQGKRRRWWDVFRVNGATDEPAVVDADGTVHPLVTADDGDAPRTPVDAPAEAYGAAESAPADDGPTEEPDAAVGTATDGDETPAPPAPPKAGFLAKLRGLKEQLFPAAERSATADQHGELAEPMVADHSRDDVAAGPPAATELQEPVALAAAVPEPSTVADAAPADDAMPAIEPERASTEETETPTGPAGPEPAAAVPGLLSRLAFWKRPSPSSGIPEPVQPATDPSAPGQPAQAATEPSAPYEAAIPQHDEDLAPAAPPTVLAGAADGTDQEAAAAAIAEPEVPRAEPIRRMKVSPLFLAGECCRAVGGAIACLFRALTPASRKPLDEAVAALAADRQRLEREVRARREAVAVLARRLRYGRHERARLLDERAKAKADLVRLQSVIAARAADVGSLEQQGTALQAELQSAASRHQALLRDIDDGHLQWESLTGTVAQTKAKLDTVSIELGIKQNDSAKLDLVMEQHRRELEAISAEAERLAGVSKATEEGVREFQAQIARLDQERNEQERYIRETSVEAGRIRKDFEQQRHQRDVLESVLAQLQQDVQVRQSLMQQLMDDGIRVKREAEQLGTQKEVLASAIQELTAERERLEQDAVRFREEARAAEQGRAAAVAGAERAAAELGRLQAECEQRGRQVADLAAKQEVHDLLSQKIAAMKDEGLALAKKLDELRSQKDLTEKALNSYRRELAAVDTAIAQRKEERARIDQQARAVDERIASFKQDIERYTAEKSRLAAAVEDGRRQLQTLEPQIAQKRDEHAAVDQRLSSVRDALSQAEGEHQALQQAAAERQRRLDAIAEEHRAFEQKLAAGRAEVARLAGTGQGLVAEIGQNTTAKAALLAQVQELKRLAAAAGQQHDAMQRQRQELETWIGEAVPFRRQQEAEIQRQLAAIQRQQQELAGLTDRIGQDGARARSIEEELARLTERLNRTTAAIADAERELQQRGEQRVAAAEAIQKLEEERDLLQGEVSALSQQADRVRALQAKADELSATMAAGQQRLEEMFQENQRLAQEKAGLQQAVKQTEAERDAARERQRTLAEEVQQIQNNLESLRQTRDRLRDELAGQEGMLKSFAEENERSRQALATQLSEAQGELDEAQRKLDGAGDLLRQTESEIASKTITRDQLDESIARLKQQHADALAQVQAATGGIEEQKQLVQQQLDALTAETEKARRSYAELDKSVQEKAAEESGLLKRLKMLSTEAGQYQSMLKQWSELSRKIEEQKRVLEDLELQAEKKSGLFS